MIRVPRDFKPLLEDLSASFRRPQTARRLIFFFAAAIVVVGDRTVSAVIRLLAIVEPINPSTFHRLFSHRRWSSRQLGSVIARFVIDRFCPDGVIRVCGDETVDGHRGKNVYGKARHRDAVRSSHSHTVYRYGHKWIVVGVLVQLPYTSRPMALPLLVALYRDRKTNQSEGRTHKTPAELMAGLLAMLMHWFPERKFVFAGDNAYGSHVSDEETLAEILEAPDPKTANALGRKVKNFDESDKRLSGFGIDLESGQRGGALSGIDSPICRSFDSLGDCAHRLGSGVNDGT